MKSLIKHFFFGATLAFFASFSLGGCKKKPAPAKPPKARPKSEAQKKAEEDAIRRVKESKTTKGFTIGAFTDLFVKMTDEKVFKQKGYNYDIQAWSAECEMPPPQEVKMKRPLTEEERRRVLAGLPLEKLGDGGNQDRKPQDGGPKDAGPEKPKGREKPDAAKKPDAGDGADAGNKEAPAKEGVAMDGGVADGGEPKSRFVRCQVQVLLGASKEQSAEHLRGSWLLGAKNLVPQNAVARMLMQDATKEDWAEYLPEGKPTERVAEKADAGAPEKMPEKAPEKEPKKPSKKPARRW
ncbi:MAG: hypothetical protein H6728_07510 [Myxococcales bacterium]|nr:hypothetical protein [Myxococcales bacterium]MCB9642908.1 hypothetical protein [Myxococcales bacterium]